MLEKIKKDAKSKTEKKCKALPKLKELKVTSNHKRVVGGGGTGAVTQQVSLCSCA